MKMEVEIKELKAVGNQEHGIQIVRVKTRMPEEVDISEEAANFFENATKIESRSDKLEFSRLRSSWKLIL